LTYDTAQFDIDPEKCGPIVLNMISNFQREYEHLLEGTFIRDIASETQGGARINYIFHKIFKKVIETIDPFENLSEQDIQTAIKNAQAMGTSLFVPEGAFEVLIKQ
jgi:dynamin 1-like protein